MLMTSAFCQIKTYYSLESALVAPEKVIKLDLNSQDLTELEANIGNFPNLKELYLQNNELKLLPSHIKNLKKLEILNLDSNNITNLPQELGELTNLQELRLNNNKLKSLPASLKNLQNLKNFSLSFNLFNHLPSELGELKNLQNLDVSFNKLSDIPDSFANLTNLQNFNLRNNKISLWNEALNQMISLKKLDISENILTNISPEIFKLKNLQQLYLTKNQIHHLPAKLSELNNLTDFYLDDNPIKKFPASLYNFLIKLNNAHSEEVANLIDEFREEKDRQREIAERDRKEAELRAQVAKKETEREKAEKEKQQAGRERAEAESKREKAEKERQKINAEKAQAEKKLAQQAQQAQEAKNQRNILIFSILAVSLLAVAFLIWRNAQQQKKANKIILHQKDLLQIEKEKSEQLLLSILPEDVARELKETGETEVRHFKLATVMFADIKGFSMLAMQLSPQELIKELDFCFSTFDEIISKYRLERIKTIGDSYMCVGGVPVCNTTNPIDTVLAALHIQAWMNEQKQKRSEIGQDYWQIRLGIHTGDLVAGVIGKTRFAYDIWGNTVNTASRMESGGEVGKVNITESTYEHIKQYFDCTPRGKIEAKNIGLIETYFVNRLLPQYSKDEKGLVANF
jgi:class 3 adenylate cyclase